MVSLLMLACICHGIRLAGRNMLKRAEAIHTTSHQCTITHFMCTQALKRWCCSRPAAWRLCPWQRWSGSPSCAAYSCRAHLYAC